MKNFKLYVGNIPNRICRMVYLYTANGGYVWLDTDSDCNYWQNCGKITHKNPRMGKWRGLLSANTMEDFKVILYQFPAVRIIRAEQFHNVVRYVYRMLRNVIAPYEVFHIRL